jgi:hypothetical protein
MSSPTLPIRLNLVIHVLAYFTHRNEIGNILVVEAVAARLGD